MQIRRHYLITGLCSCLIFAGIALRVHAQESTPPIQDSGIQSKIESRNADIKNLEKEIAEYQSQIDLLDSKQLSLSETLKSLDLTQKKLQSNIKLTQEKIEAKNLEIKNLTTQIHGTVDTITDTVRYTQESFRAINEVGDLNAFKILIGSDNYSRIWNTTQTLDKLREGLQTNIQKLTTSKELLEKNKSSTEDARADLEKLKKQLNGERAATLDAKTEQNKLLRDTQNSESAFRNILQEKMALKDAFEKEISQYESSLNLSVDISKVPLSGSRALAWPVDDVFITQFFGNTRFATKNAQLYSGAGHNGIDFRASIGTPVKAAMTGVIAGVGNTDIVPRCYSLGKWILINHQNGLSTLYAHLGLQSVAVGNTVHTGDVIGYSGNTGYTTGPHLHFGVYASSGIEIKQFTNSKSCHNAILPIAVLKAYLNPLSYLPPYQN